MASMSNQFYNTPFYTVPNNNHMKNSLSSYFLPSRGLHSAWQGELQLPLKWQAQLDKH